MTAQYIEDANRLAGGNVAAMLPHLPQRWRAFRCGPVNLKIVGTHDAAQRSLGEGIGAVAIALPAVISIRPSCIF